MPADPSMGNCWLWTGGVMSRGYGICAIGVDYTKAENHENNNLAHRVSFLIVNGRWPDPEIDHLCHNKLCVRTSHLKEATRLENMNNRRCSKICRRGHPLADPNLYYVNTKRFGIRRRCLACHTVQVAKDRERHRLLKAQKQSEISSTG